MVATFASAIPAGGTQWRLVWVRCNGDGEREKGPSVVGAEEGEEWRGVKQRTSRQKRAAIYFCLFVKFTFSIARCCTTTPLLIAGKLVVLYHSNPFHFHMSSHTHLSPPHLSLLTSHPNCAAFTICNILGCAVQYPPHISHISSSLPTHTSILPPSCQSRKGKKVKSSVCVRLHAHSCGCST
mmetsp:Transcript_49851/g.128271  ORF Transcript_49851/g.128271 Transcript_49851/m.128271 type:complete len:182 (-) Transcript_49851:116-661(-)